MLRQPRDPRDQHLGRGTRERIARMMLGQPVAPVAQAIAELRQFERLGDGLRGRAAGADRRLIEDAEAQELEALLAHGQELVLAALA
jgi:hypothetical protein